MNPFLTVATFLFSAVFHCASGQLKETKLFCSQNGLCSRKMILDGSGYFFNSWGCKGRHNIIFGRYKIEKGNKVAFKVLPFDSLAPIEKVVTEKIVMEHDSLVTFTFYDRFEKPLATNFRIRVTDAKDQVHEMRTDEKGQVEVNRFLYNNIFLAPLLSIYGKSHSIAIGRESVNIYLSLPELFFAHSELTVSKLQKFSLQLKKDGLYHFNRKVPAYKLQK